LSERASGAEQEENIVDEEGLEVCVWRGVHVRVWCVEREKACVPSGDCAS